MKVLVTGAAGGIGSECVKILSAIKGCEVIAVSRSKVLLENLKAACFEENGNSIDIIVSDFQDTTFHLPIKKHIEAKYGSLDGLINNAGMLINKNAQEINRKDIQEQMRINFEAPFQLTQALKPLLEKSKRVGHVVNIGSMGGFQGSQKFPGLSIYSASKGALAILTESLAAEWANENIRVNCLALGSADTEMLRKAFPEYRSSMSAHEMAKYIVDFTINGHRIFNGKIIPVAGLTT